MLGDLVSSQDSAEMKDIFGQPIRQVDMSNPTEVAHWWTDDYKRNRVTVGDDR